jgi:hypothetical protein
MRRCWSIVNWSLLLCAIATSAASCVAQEKPELPTVQQDVPALSGAVIQQDENPKRILGIIPNFQSKDEDIPENHAPMTPREKYILAYHQTVDFSAHFGNAFQAVLQQAANGQPHYGQGWGLTRPDSAQRRRTRSLPRSLSLGFCRTS